ncbi:methylated-DNA--[protein]-cysteine S-methyltransferase [Pusillimonas sp. MFBS29]|uniref:methylated-DNA--[protein]-cysteine S-methyltransferase n=1 Tax=Pusillimonas sp. MFBS29 TaxID=2886690 RepID=UPI00351D91DE
MRFYARLNSPLGAMLLSSNGTHLDGLYFDDQKDRPPVDGLAPVKAGKADPTAGMMAGAAIKDFKAYKKAVQADLFDNEDQNTTGPAGGGPGAAWDAQQCLVVMQPDTPAGALSVFQQTLAELQEYFNGDRRVFGVPLHLHGTDFQIKVWEALLAIPYGEYVSYGDVALSAGLTAQHGRPVGTAVGRNPVSIIVPCHRVLAGSGRLNGYTGGLERKFALLELEGFTLA